MFVFMHWYQINKVQVSGSVLGKKNTTTHSHVHKHKQHILAHVHKKMPRQVFFLISQQKFSLSSNLCVKQHPMFLLPASKSVRDSRY